MTFAKPYPWPTPVFVNEFDAGGHQNSFYLLKCGRIPAVTTNLNIVDCISVKTGRLGQIADRPI